MVRSHGAGLLEDSPVRASPEPQVRPLAPCFTVRSPGRDTTPDIRPMCFGAPDFRSCSLINDALESRRAQRALRSGTATTENPRLEKAAKLMVGCVRWCWVWVVSGGCSRPMISTDMPALEGIINEGTAEKIGGAKAHWPNIGWRVGVSRPWDRTVKQGAGGRT